MVPAGRDVLVGARRSTSATGCVELVHPGRGHTGGDLVVRVADADVLLAGDLVEQSAPPSYGADCFPLEWPGALDLVVGMLTPAPSSSPATATPVDERFVQDQRADVGTVAETVVRPRLPLRAARRGAPPRRSGRGQPRPSRTRSDVATTTSPGPRRRLPLV